MFNIPRRKREDEESGGEKKRMTFVQFRYGLLTFPSSRIFLENRMMWPKCHLYPTGEWWQNAQRLKRPFTCAPQSCLLCCRLSEKKLRISLRKRIKSAPNTQPRCKSTWKRWSLCPCQCKWPEERREGPEYHFLGWARRDRGSDAMPLPKSWTKMKAPSSCPPLLLSTCFLSRVALGTPI